MMKKPGYLKNSIVIVSFMAILFGCKKNEVSYSITVYNPEPFSIEIRSMEFVAGFVPGESEVTFYGYKNKKDFEFIEMHFFNDQDGWGELDEFGCGISIGMKEGGDFRHEICSGIVTEL